MSDLNLKEEIKIGMTNTELVNSTAVDGVSTPLVTIKSILTNDYLTNLEKNISPDYNGILPSNCRYTKAINEKTTIFVIEDKPKIRKVRFNSNLNVSDIQNHGQHNLNACRFINNKLMPYSLMLSFPYIVYIAVIEEDNNYFDISDFKVFFRKHPISSINDYLYIANLWNLSGENNLCFGNHFDDFHKNDYSISKLFDKLNYEFWSRPFKAEYTSRHGMYRNHSRLHNFLVWAHYTQIDPTFIYSEDWILNKQNLSTTIRCLKSGFSASKSTTFKKVFIESMKNEIDNNNIGSNNSGLYHYDNMTIYNSKVLSLGDQINYNGNNFYVYDIIGNRDIATHVELIDDNNNKCGPIEVTSEMHIDWKEQIEAQLNNYKDQMILGGKTIKIDSLVKIIPTNSFDVVEKIRLNRDGMYEIICGENFYIATQDMIELADSIIIRGAKLEKGNSYIVCDESTQIAFRGKLTKIENYLRQLYFHFSTQDQEIIEMSSSNLRGSLIFEADNNNIMNTNVFRYLDKLYVNKKEDQDKNNYYIIRNRGVYPTASNIYLFKWNYDKDIVINSILSPDNRSLNIPSIDVDINFNVGDEVIVCDWENPDFMFKIRKISGFEHDGLLLKIKTLDSDNNEVIIDYIDLLTGKIKAGYVRKVSSEYNGIPVGSLIKSGVIGFFGFPKKDINEISAFLIDSERVMILCKSGLTLWFDELHDKFDVLLPDTKEHKRIKNIKSLDIDNIKWQSGDLCYSRGEIWIIDNDSNGRVVYHKLDADVIRKGSFSGNREYYFNIDYSYKRYGIIGPRYRKNNSEIMRNTIPNLHNGCVKDTYYRNYPHTIKIGEE